MSERIYINHLLERREGLDTAAIAASRGLLTPNTQVSGRMIDGGIWIPPHPSIASRRPSLRSKGSCRGAMVDRRTNRVVVFESKLEAGLATMLLARQDIKQIIDQPPAVSYKDRSGKTRTHIFDFLAVTKAGSRIAIAVKPECKLEKSGIQDTVGLIREQVGQRFADRYLVRTDRQITRSRVANAELVLRSRLCRNEADVAKMRDIASTLCGAATIISLITQSGMGARAFNAVVNLIDHGDLQTVGAGRIDYLSSVYRPSIQRGEWK